MNSKAESTINHFSHPHTLQLSNHQNSLTPVSCSGCKLKATGLIYSCSTCNYFLHVKCSKMPQQITHPFDKDHVFSLLPKPLYAEGFFNCDACGKQGDGFCYHCKICNLDLHILCAAMPLNFTHQSHKHQLKLIFSPPHMNKMFYCNICNTRGSNHWLYRCEICDFDIHLDCTNNVPAPAAAPAMQSNINQSQTTFTAFPIQTPIPQVHHHIQQPGMASRSAPQVPPQAPPNYQAFNPQCAAATGVPVPNFMPSVIPGNQGIQAPLLPFVQRQNNEHLLALQRLQALFANSSQNSFNQHYMQTLLAGGGVGGGVGGPGGGVGGVGGGVGGLGGGVGGIGGGGNLGGMQHLIQAFSGLGNGVGSNIPGLDLFGNGGSGGLNILQGLMGGGGGGNVLDILGGDGGLSMLNGLDLGGLLGGFSF